MNHQFDFSNHDHFLEKADAIKAVSEGSAQSAQFLDPDRGEWKTSLVDPNGWHPYTRYRRAPVPAVKWWSEPRHVPCPCWIQDSVTDLAVLVDGVDQLRIKARSFTWSFEHLERLNIKWSPTHLGPFKPCTIPS